MSAMAAGERGRSAGASRRRTTAPPPRQRVLAAVPGPPRTQAPAPRPGAGDPPRRPASQAPPRRVASQAPPRSAGTRAHPRTTLTRRGRMVVSALVMGIRLGVAAIAWIAGATRADAARSGPPASAVYRSLRSVVVQPGQSLWTIAAQAEPSADPRGVIQEIIDLNALGGSSIQPGQHLWVPRG
jgi:hypothetical protein